MKIFDRSSSILIATFSPWKSGKRLPINGNVEPLLDFFKPRVRKVTLIDQVYPGSDLVMPIIEQYKKGKGPTIKKNSILLYVLYPFLYMFNTDGTHILFKIRDFFSVIDIGLRDDEKYDFFIGLEAINALAGICLRKIGKIKTVIYYVSDYSPNRYRQKWFNDLYLRLDRYAAMHADIIWDVSWAIHPARIKAGLDQEKSAKVLQVPNALYPTQIVYNKKSNLTDHSLVFMGTLGVENGPDIAIDAVAIVLNKYPDAILHIIGGGDNDLERLKKKVSRLDLDKQVVFHGFIGDRNKVSQTIKNFSLALAPYKAISGSPRLYGDATKIRAYLAAGLPTITTHVPPLGKDAAKKGAVLIVKDNRKAFAIAIDKIFSDREMYERLKRNAISFAKNNTWENEYTKAFEQMEKL